MRSTDCSQPCWWSYPPCSCVGSSGSAQRGPSSQTRSCWSSGLESCSPGAFCLPTRFPSPNIRCHMAGPTYAWVWICRTCARPTHQLSVRFQGWPSQYSPWLVRIDRSSPGQHQKRRTDNQVEVMLDLYSTCNSAPSLPDLLARCQPCADRSQNHGCAWWLCMAFWEYLWLLSMSRSLPPQHDIPLWTRWSFPIHFRQSDWARSPVHHQFHQVAPPIYGWIVNIKNTESLKWNNRDRMQTYPLHISGCTAWLLATFVFASLSNWLRWIWRINFCTLRPRFSRIHCDFSSSEYLLNTFCFAIDHLGTLMPESLIARSSSIILVSPKQSGNSACN